MSNYHELACFTDVVDRTMISIIWRAAKKNLTKYSTQEAHLGINKFSIHVAILITWHLVEKLSK